MLNFLATTENLRNIRSDQSNYNRGKVVKKSNGNLLFAISRHKITLEKSCFILKLETKRLREENILIRSGPE